MFASSSQPRRPRGYISLEDGYAIEPVQQAIVHAGDDASFIELGEPNPQARTTW